MESADWHVLSPNAHKGDNETYFHELDKHNNPTSIENHGGEMNNFEGIDQIFLNQLEHNLYDSVSLNPHMDKERSENGIDNNNTHGELGSDENIMSNSRHETPSELGEHMNFMIADGIDFETKNFSQSSAYPPSNLPPHTPSLMGSKNLGYSQDLEGNKMPILPGQNEKSYNNQHFFHKQSKNPNNDSYQGIRPDAVFTPLVSPAITPLDSQVNTNKSYNQPVQTVFEPLTSPALNAQHPLNVRRRSSSSMFGPNDEQAPSYKRKTPHGTPILQANNSKVKQNLTPSMKHSNSKGSLSNFERLPESSINSSKSSVENTPMLPPQGKKVDISSNTPEQNTMMGFTMGRLAEQKLENENSQFSITSTRKSTRFSTTRRIASKSSSSSETSPVITAQSNDPSVEQKPGKPAAKKASHKLAEQGRRNRMNTAVQELSNLIPQSYHDEVTIPSKATTVELASKYIRELLNEIEKLKNL